MTQEEKAKAYDIALDKIRRLLGTGSNCSREDLEHVFPELRESEDERIRTRLIDYFSGFYDRFASDRNHTNVRWEGLEVKKVLAWLEKQGEQKPDDKVEPKFKAGDKIISTISNIPYYVTEVCDEYYLTDVGCIIMFNAQDNFELSKQKPEWSEEDETGWTNTMIMIKESATKHYTKDSIKIVVDWLESLKDRVIPQPKQEWSKEDEDTIKFLISHFCVSHCNGMFLFTSNKLITHDELLEKIRNLRPQSQWKPSDEQMEALKYSTYCPNEQMSKVLFELYQDLKNL